MDEQRFGGVVRGVRRRRRLTQTELAERARVSQPTISRIERGHVGTLRLETIRSVAAVLDIRVELLARWRGGDLDRLINARHSALHDALARELAGLADWVFEPEVSFSIWGERGVVDILAFNTRRKALLVIELKTEIVDVNELVGTLDRKVRLAREIARTREWSVPAEATVSAWVIVADGRTNRRRIQAHAAMLRAALPSDGRSVAGWLHRPRKALRCLSFWPSIRPGTGRPGSTRRKGPRRRVPERSHSADESCGEWMAGWARNAAGPRPDYSPLYECSPLNQSEPEYVTITIPNATTSRSAAGRPAHDFWLRAWR